MTKAGDGSGYLKGEHMRISWLVFQSLTYGNELMSVVPSEQW